jgi:hypothetical protein
MLKVDINDASAYREHSSMIYQRTILIRGVKTFGIRYMLPLHYIIYPASKIRRVGESSSPSLAKKLAPIAREGWNREVFQRRPVRRSLHVI